MNSNKRFDLTLKYVISRYLLSVFCALLLSSLSLAFETARPTEDFFEHISGSDVVAIVEFETTMQFSVKEILFESIGTNVPKMMEYEGKKIGRYTKRIPHADYHLVEPAIIKNIPYLVFLNEYMTYEVKPNEYDEGFYDKETGQWKLQPPGQYTIYAFSNAANGAVPLVDMDTLQKQIHNRKFSPEKFQGKLPSDESINNLILKPMADEYGTTDGVAIKNAYKALDKLYALENEEDRAKFFLKPENIGNPVFLKVVADLLDSVSLKAIRPSSQPAQANQSTAINGVPSSLKNKTQ